MRILGLAILCLAIAACDSESTNAGRYQQITNPPVVSCTSESRFTAPDCGLMILDTKTGTIFIREMSDWREENPHTGLVEEHPLK